MKKITILIFVMSLALIAVPVLAKNDKSRGPKSECTTIQSGNLVNSSGDEITTGFNEWGYNYQAKIFNGGYCDAYQDAGWCQPWADVSLLMKWNDAWLSNKDCDGDGLLDRHYGSDSYIGSGAWLTNHMKGSYEGEDYYWDVTGDWLLDFAGGTDNRKFVNLTQDSEGNVKGDFLWFTSGEWAYGGKLAGNVNGDALYLYYERDPIYNYTGEFYGTIGDNVITDGTFTDSRGNELTWSATGAAVKNYEICEWTYFTKIVAVPDDSYQKEGNWYTEDGLEIGPVIWGEFATIQVVENDPCAGYEGIQYKGEAPSGFGFYKP